MVDKDIGVMEWWSVGVELLNPLLQHSITPIMIVKDIPCLKI
jgi:hypothetical protein